MSWDSLQPLGRLLAGSRLPSFDGIRMVAVALVILSHAGYEDGPSDIGVNIFFVLSGFLITWLLLKEREKTGAISLKTFYVRRAFRLLPAYYVFMVVALGQYYGRHIPGGTRTDIVLPGLFYYTNYFNAVHDHPPTPLSHTWSLAIEEQFYLVWPLAFALLMRWGRRAVAGFLVPAIVVVVAWRSYLYVSLDVGTAYVYNAFETRFDTLAIGCLTAVLSQDARFVAGAQAISRRWYLPLITLVVLFVQHAFRPDTFTYTVGFTLDGLLIAVAILQLLLLVDHPAWRWLEHPIPRYLGTISYPIYLYHGLCNAVAGRLVPDLRPLRFLLAFACAALVGTLSFYLIEKPFLRLRDRLTRPAPKPPAQA